MTPAIVPPIVISSGMMKCSKSINVADDQERNENPVGKRNLPGESPPDGEKEKGGQQFDTEIAKSDLASAICASAHEEKAS